MNFIDTTSEQIVYRIAGDKQYELQDHLGNVRALVSDVKAPLLASGLVYSSEAEVLSYNNYYPFGMLQPQRNYNAGDYRYGFNGMEKDDEVKGSGNSYDFGARIYDSRLGRFFSNDPDASKYPFWSPYLFAADNPLKYIDVEGLGPGDVVVALSGADLFSQGEENTSTAGLVANDVLKNSPGTSAKAFSSTFWKTILVSTPYGTSMAVVKETDLDKITQKAYDYVMSNKTKDGKIIIYGYSHGGVLANHLAKRLAKANVSVDLLVTIDAAAGPQSDKVDRSISDNVKKNINIYQRKKSGIGSRGDANKSKDPKKVDNRDKSADNVDHGNIDEKTKETAVKEITNTLNK